MPDPNCWDPTIKSSSPEIDMQNGNVVLHKAIILKLWILVCNPGGEMQLGGGGNLAGGCLGRKLIGRAGGQALTVGILVFIICSSKCTFLHIFY